MKPLSPTLKSEAQRTEDLGMEEDKKIPWYLHLNSSNLMKTPTSKKPDRYWEWRYVYYHPIKFMYENTEYNNNIEDIDKFILEIMSSEFKQSQLYIQFRTLIDEFNYEPYIGKVHILSTILERK